MRPRLCIIGVGSNLDPLDNVPRLVEHLLEQFGKLHASSFHYTEPVTMRTRHRFVNGVLALETALPADELKELFNSIETALGRDRDHPESSAMDRPADLDIVYLGALPADGPLPGADVDSYHRDTLAELLAYLRGSRDSATDGLSMMAFGQPFGVGATTLERSRPSHRARTRKV